VVEKTRAAKDAGDFFGDAYTFVAIERTSKLIVAWHLGKRTVGHTYTFAEKLDRATAMPVQVALREATCLSGCQRDDSRN
jgi:hypothetical protein